RRTLLLAADPDAAESGQTVAGTGADVSLPVAGIHGPLPPVAARPGRDRRTARGAVLDHRHGAAAGRHRAVAELAGRGGALPAAADAGAFVGRRHRRPVRHRRVVHLVLDRAERIVRRAVRAYSATAAGADAGDHPLRPGAAGDDGAGR